MEWIAEPARRSTYQQKSDGRDPGYSNQVWAPSRLQPGIKQVRKRELEQTMRIIGTGYRESHWSR